MPAQLRPRRDGVDRPHSLEMWVQDWRPRHCTTTRHVIINRHSAERGVNAHCTRVLLTFAAAQWETDRSKRYQLHGYGSSVRHDVFAQLSTRSASSNFLLWLDLLLSRNFELSDFNF